MKSKKITTQKKPQCTEEQLLEVKEVREDEVEVRWRISLE